MTEDSFSAPASGLSINKIPFLVFDAILVITAVALAFSADSPLAPAVFFWILLCVVAGGIVGCLPFWIEFRDRVRLSEYEVREQQNSAHDSQWQYVDARLAEQNEFLNKLHLRLSDVGDRLGGLETRPPFPSADEVATLCGNALQKQWPAWREELLATLSRRTDLLFNEQNAQSTKLSAAHEKRLGELRKEFLAVETALRGLDTRVNEIALLATASAASAGAQLAAKAAPVQSGMAADSDVAQQIKSTISTEVSPSALSDEGQPDGQAAIIFEPEEPEADTRDAEALEDGATDKAAPVVEHMADSAGEESGSFTASEAEPVSIEEDAVQATEVTQTPEAGSAPTPADVASTDETGDVPAPLPVISPLPTQGKAPTGGGKTTLVAQVLIGIGNKPYVRGIGPGLSMEKGVPMQFVEIGKWEWVCPNGHEPVKIQIYKNDEIPSNLGEIEIEPGQRRAVTPTFPR